MKDLYILAPIISAIGVLFVIGYVFGQRQKTRVNRAFLRFACAIFSVIFLEVFIRLPLDPQFNSVATKLAGAIFFSLSILFFDFVCAVVNRPKTLLYKFFFATIIVTAIASLFVDHHRISSEIVADKSLVIPTLLYIPLFACAIVLPSIWSVIVGIQGLRREMKGSRKRKFISIILWSIVLSTLYAILVLIIIPIFWKNYEIYRLVSLGTLIHMGALFWAVTRYKFMSIDIDKVSEVSQELFRNVDEGIILMDLSGNLIQANNTAVNILGDNEKRIDRKRLEDVVADYDFSAHYSGHKTVGRRNGEMRRLIISQSQVGSSSESPFQLLILRDITEQSAIEDELFKKRQLDSLGILAGGIAHDFNNLLTGISSIFSLLRLEKKVNAEHREILKEGQRATFEAAKLTQQLLTFSMGGTPVCEPLDIHHIIDESVRFSLRGSKSTYTILKEDDVKQVLADPAQLGQVFHNLALNAVQAMEHGGIVSIAISNDIVASKNVLGLKGGEYVRLEFSDTGSGMEESVSERVFEPYFSTKESGVGLGLATVYSILRKHNGHIEVSSEPDKGTTFTILLPATDKKPAVSPDDNTEIGAFTGRILLMDDEDTVRIVGQKLLETLGYTVDTAAEGSEALKCFQKHFSKGEKYLAAIVDLTIPTGMGGVKLAKNLLKLDSKLRIIVSSGYSNDPVMANYQKYGFFAMLKKPYQLSELKSVLGKAVDVRN